MENKVFEAYSVGCTDCDCGGILLASNEDHTESKYVAFKEKKDAINFANGLADDEGNIPPVKKIEIRVVE